ncbi:MATE family efflux transporter [Parvicella tangerina]|uniref:Multidrug-efflux transporter n=1 Tax=Parvicella tangerina TaxID=2829795 RepID=A0A916NAS8_9FLAO|nr:MATE family efflux transporter [Parvicella tangerina]CAG5081364.1 Multidrug resistance protein MdtK [Parvicella tangerina]
MQEKTHISTKHIGQIALPIMLGGIAQNVVNVTDTAFLGNLGDTQVGAAGNAGILYFLLVHTCLGFTTGAQIIMGRRNGEQNYKAIGQLLDQTLYFVIPLALIMFFVMQFLSPALLTEVVSSSSIRSAASDFLNIRSYGILFALIVFAFNAFYIGVTRTRVIMIGTILMSATNVVLDYGLIFGNLGLPEMGIKGAALASVIAEFVAALFIILATVFLARNKRYELFKFRSPDLSVLRSITRISTPIMFQNFITLGSWFVFFMMIEWIGEEELAISHIIKSIYMVMMIPMFGLSTAANTITSNLIGEQRSDQVLPTTWKIVGLSIILTLPLALLSFIFSDDIILLYTENATLLPAAKKTLWVVDISMFFFCVAYIHFNSVTGTGDTMASLAIETINIIIYLGSTALFVTLLEPHIHIVWCAEFIYFTFLGFMAWGYLKYGKWRLKQL